MTANQRPAGAALGAIAQGGRMATSCRRAGAGPRADGRRVPPRWALGGRNAGWLLAYYRAGELGGEAGADADANEHRAWAAARRCASRWMGCVDTRQQNGNCGRAALGLQEIELLASWAFTGLTALKKSPARSQSSASRSHPRIVRRRRLAALA